MGDYPYVIPMPAAFTRDALDRALRTHLRGAQLHELLETLRRTGRSA